MDRAQWNGCAERRIALDRRKGPGRLVLGCLETARLERSATPTGGRSGSARDERVIVMLDFLMIAYGVGFFIAAVLYVLACEKM